MAKSAPRAWTRQPSWWVVLIAGTLFVVFIVAITREVINSRGVARQVRRLESEVAIEQRRQEQLQDLIDYLNSPTFREQEARLKLGLKKEGEQVVVVPPSNAVATNDGSTPADGDSAASVSVSHPQAWWRYFFGS